jgi:hypothetical protein
MVEFLGLLLIGLGLVSLIGHGLWLLAAAVFRTLLGESAAAPTPPERWTECPRCERYVTPGSPLCPGCGLVLDGPVARELADLEATARQLRRFHHEGVLPTASFDQLQSQLDSRRRQLSRGTLAGEARVSSAESPERDPALDVLSVEVVPSSAPPVAEPEDLPRKQPDEPPRPTPVVSPPVISPSPAPALAPASAAAPIRETGEIPLPAEPAAPPRPPRRSVGELLAAFMEQRNILWGELVGGILIVGCSVALVISLWTTLEENPLYQFGSFVGVTAALFGAGLYTLNHWKLESTSRGLLVIAALLVPLNLLAITTAQVQHAGGLLVIAAELAALALFGWLLGLAGKVLVPEGRWWFALAVLGTSTGQLLVPPILGSAEANTRWLVLLLGLIPTASHGLGIGGVLRRIARQPLRTPQAHSLFALVGMATFALAVALGLLVFWSIRQDSTLGEALQRVAVLVSLAGVPIIVSGIHVQRSLAADGDTGAVRTAGTALALTGMVVMLAGLLLAWPRPVEVVVVSALDFTVLTYVAFRHRLPIAHAVALPCLLLGYLAAWHLLPGWLPEGASLGPGLALSAESSKVLVGLVLLLGAAAELLSRAGLQSHARTYALGAGGIAVVSLFGITWPTGGAGGIDAPASAMVVYALQGAGALAVNLRWRRPLASSLGLALLAVATLWGLWWMAPHRLPLWGAVLSAEALLLGVAAVWLGHPYPPERHFRDRESGTRELIPAFAEPLARTSEALSVTALLAGLWGGLSALAWSFEHVLTGSFLAALFLLLAAVEGRGFLARAAGLMVIVSAAAGAGWAATLAGAVELTPWIALSVAAASTLLAGAAVACARIPRAPDEPGPAVHRPWYRVLAGPWLEMAAVAGIVALLLVGTTLPPPSSPLHAGTGILLTATALLLAWGYDTAALTWIGSTLALGSIAWSLYHWQLAAHVPWLDYPTPLLDLALLAHATLLLVTAISLQGFIKARATGVSRGIGRVHRLLAEPFEQAALVSSVLALPLLVGMSQRPLLVPALGLFWLSAAWLVISVVRRWPALFSAFQAVLSLAVLFATTAWLDGQVWFVGHPEGPLVRWWDPRTLQAYGIGLAGLSLLWVAVRLVLRSHALAQGLLEPGWPMVDRVVPTLVIAGQLLLAVWGVLPALANELAPVGTTEATALWPPALRAFTHGSGAWALLGLLALVLFTALWDRWAPAAALGLVVIALTIPVLGAGEFEASRATAPALRWGLAAAFVLVSLLLWLRRPLHRLASFLGERIPPGSIVPTLAQALLIAGAVAPVLFLTVWTAATELGGGNPVQPVETSFFGRMSWRLAALGPLVLTGLGLAGHALRDRSPAYAFAAGLVVNLTVTGAHALGFVKSHGPLGGPAGEQLAAQLVELGTITAALWAIAWLAVRAGRSGWAGTAGATDPFSESPLARPLLKLQIGLGVAGSAWLIGFALWLAAAFFPRAEAWTLETGSLLGWLALGTSVAAAFLHQLQGRSLVRPLLIGLVVLATIGLLACSVERWRPGEGWAYRTVMLGWAAYPLAWVLAVVWPARRIVEGRGQPADPSTPRSAEWQDVAAFWAYGAGMLAVLLGLKAAFWHAEQLWAAGAIALVSPALAIVAGWQRREAEAFVAGLGVNLAASLVVWHYHPHDLAEWWVYLLQANIIALALVALLWLALRHRLYGERELSIRLAPLLALQVALELAGNLILLGVPLLLLVWSPGAALPRDLWPAGSIAGVVACALTAVSAVWYARQTVPEMTIHVMGGLGLGIGALAACEAAQGNVPTWTALHRLMGVWTVIAGVMVALGGKWGIGWFGRPGPEHGLLSSVDRSLRGWVLAIGFLVVGLALRGTWAGDPAAPGWPTGATLAISVLFGCLALRSRQPFEVYASGLLLSVVGGLIWWGKGPGAPDTFFFTQVLCLAIASASWSAVELGLRRLAPARELRGPWLPFTHVSAALAACLMGILVIVAVASSLSGGGTWVPPVPAWAALGGVVVALIFCLWDPTAAFPLGGLYAAGLMAMGLALHGADMAPEAFCRAAPLALAPYVLLTAGLAWAGPRMSGLARTLRLPEQAGGGIDPWFLPAQALVACLVVGLSLWMSLTPAGLRDRLAGPLAAGIVLPAGVLMAGPKASRWQLATLALGVLVVVEIGWALLEPAGRQASWLWLHRSVLLMATLAVMTLLYGLALARWLPRATGWAQSSRQLGPLLGMLACFLVAAVLAQEALLYAGEETGAPMAPLAILGVAAALVGLIVAAAAFAVVPGKDPLGLSERGRTLYVYGAEVLLVLVFVHLRLTVPGLFRLGLFMHYWPFILMALAFAGAGLSEFFQRRGMPVLAEPLERTGVFLPMLPVVAIWAMPAGNYALVWFLTGLLYALLSLTKRSFWFALLAALSANAGMWVLLHANEIHFFKHPQLWVIPLALVALASEHLNRDRLTPYQCATLRYFALMVIYVSSTADMFIAGLGESVVLPLVLAVLSVAGVLAGMLLRVRAFLFLGVTFLLFVILTMIWHAGVDRRHTWILWSFGIVLGAAILTLFGIFEKRRNEVLHLVEQLRQWH